MGGCWVGGFEELEIKPTLQVRVGQNVFLRVSDDPYLCGQMYVSWDEIRLHTINQIPRLPGSALKGLLLMTRPA